MSIVEDLQALAKHQRARAGSGHDAGRREEHWIESSVPCLCGKRKAFLGQSPGLFVVGVAVA